jgi:hypothetical protein
MTEDNRQHGSFTLRFPFELPKSQQIAGVEKPGARFDFTIGDLDFTLRNDDPYYVLIGTGFTSEEAARRFISRLEAGLIWLLIHRGFAAVKSRSGSFMIGVESTPELEYADRPIVYPTGCNIRLVKMGRPSLGQDVSAKEVCILIAEGISELGSSELLEDLEYRTAVDLYNACHWEASNNARFLTLVMALEALVTTPPRPEPVLSMIKNWREEANALLKEYEKGTEEYKDVRVQVASINGQITNILMRESITRRIKELVNNTLEPDTDIRESKLVGTIADIYDVRSKLVHNGYVPPDKLLPALNEAHRIVRAILMAKFKGNV